jgi:putative membrane protein
MSERKSEGFDLGRMLARWLVNGAAVWVTFQIVPGIHPTKESAIAMVVIALILGLVNAVIRPIVALLTCPLIILTLGLGTLLINTLMFWLAGEIGKQFGYGYTVDGFWPAFFGAIVVSVVSMVLSVVLGVQKRDD